MLLSHRDYDDGGGCGAMEILRWHLRKEGDSKYTLKFIILRALRSRFHPPLPAKPPFPSLCPTSSSPSYTCLSPCPCPLHTTLVTVTCASPATFHLFSLHLVSTVFLSSFFWFLFLTLRTKELFWYQLKIFKYENDVTK